MKSLFSILAVLLTAVSAASVKEYPFYREFSGKGKEAGIIVFDLPLYRNTDDGFSNIRILDEDNKPVPFTIRDERERKTVTVYEKKRPVTRYEWGKYHTVEIALPLTGRTEKEKETVLTVDAGRVPCSSLEITADDRYFSRTVTVAAGKKQLASAEITQEKKEIHLPEYRSGEYTVTIRNQDDAPLKNIRLVWKTKKKTIVFTDREKKLRLYYGGDAPAPQYDLERLVDLFETFREYAPGEERKNPSFAPSVSAEKIRRGIMWGVISAAAAVLFIVIIRLLNKE